MQVTVAEVPPAEEIRVLACWKEGVIFLSPASPLADSSLIYQEPVRARQGGINLTNHLIDNHPNIDNDWTSALICNDS